MDNEFFILLPCGDKVVWYRMEYLAVYFGLKVLINQGAHSSE